MIRRALAASLFFWPVLHSVSAAELGRLVPVELKSGSNQVPNATPDGRPAMIVRAWHENGNAHSYNLFLTMTKDADPAAPWRIVPIEPAGPGAPASDTVRDDPHTFEDMKRSVRFARAPVDGDPSFLLIVATRDMPASGSLTDASEVTFDVYRLEIGVNDLEAGLDQFVSVSHGRSRGRYCNADLALFQEMGLSLPTDYAGPANLDGCPKDE